MGAGAGHRSRDASSTSLRCGMPVCAPRRSTASPAATTAHRAASASGRRSASATGEGGGEAVAGPDGVDHVAGPGRDVEGRAAGLGDHRAAPPRVSAIEVSSERAGVGHRVVVAEVETDGGGLGLVHDQDVETEVRQASPGVAGAALQTTSAPSPRARPSASTATGRGTSSETRTASVPGAMATSTGRRAWFAPAATTMRFSPAWSTQTVATPVGASTCRTPARSMPDSRRPLRRDRRELVGPDGHGHRRAGAEPGRRHRLVGALASGRPGDVVGGHGGPGAGQLVDDDDEVGVGAAHHMDGRRPVASTPADAIDAPTHRVSRTTHPSDLDAAPRSRNISSVTSEPRNRRRDRVTWSGTGRRPYPRAVPLRVRRPAVSPAAYRRITLTALCCWCSSSSPAPPCG